MLLYTLLGTGIIFFIIIGWYIKTHNSFVLKKNRVKQCESGICVALKQRNDMIPNLVTAVKAYMNFENETLTRVAELRSQADKATDEQTQIRLGGQLSAALPGIKAVIEQYPQLKANEQFVRLESSIEEMEMQLQAIRRTYNAAVVSFNNYVEMFPSSIVAGMKNYTTMQLIDIPETEKQNVDVNSLFVS